MTALMTPDELYRLVGQLLQEMPDFGGGTLTPQQHMWLGRARALVDEGGDIHDGAVVTLAIQNMDSPRRRDQVERILACLYNTLAAAELKVSPGLQGAFIQAGNAFSAFEAIAKVMRSAQSDALVVDPYLDEKVLTDYAVTLPENCTLRLLAENGKLKASLKPAVTRWQTQYTTTRPIEARAVAPPETLHDRLVIIDNTTVYTLTQSLNAFATRAPASIVRVDPENAALKVAAYHSIWASAVPL